MPAMNTVIPILRHTPPWVWAMLVALLALGLSQLRQRRVAPLRLLLLPAVLLVLGLWSMGPAFVQLPLVALAWLLALAGGVALGRRLPRPAAARWLADERRLLLPGSVLPLLVILLVFSLRYSSGVAMALHPEWRADVAVQLPLSLLFGWITGMLLGRSLALHALSRPDNRGQ
jgi:hypothetical protein